MEVPVKSAEFAHSSHTKRVDLVALLNDAERIARLRRSNVRRFRDSPATHRPFGSDWRPFAGEGAPTKDVAAGIKFDNQLREHLRQVRTYFLDVAKQPDELKRFALLDYGSMLNRTLRELCTSDTCRRLLDDHIQCLRDEVAKQTLVPTSAALPARAATRTGQRHPQTNRVPVTTAQRPVGQRPPQRGIPVPAGLPARIEAVRKTIGLSWESFAARIKLDQKTVRRARKLGAVEMSTLNTLIQFVEQQERLASDRRQG